MIRIEELTKKFTGVIAVSLTIDKGEIYGLLGLNGTGKTTLLKMLCGLLPRTSRSISIGNFDIDRDLFRIKKRIGVVPQYLAI